MTLQTIDRNTILKSFAIDSENRGYSDKAKEALKKDEELLNQTNLSQEDKKQTYKIIENIFKMYRVLLLSKNQEEYLKNKTKIIIYLRCLNEFLYEIGDSIPNFEISIYSQNFSEFETKKFVLIGIVLKEKYYYNLPYQTIFKINNPEVSKESCLKIE